MKFKLNKTMKVELKASYPGQTPKEAGPVVFVMEISTLYASYQADHDLIFLADETRVTGSGGAYFSMRDGVVGQKEIITHIFRAEDFKEILDAKKLEARIGKTEFTIKEDQLKLMRDFYNSINSVPKENS
jgi:hypothetical protein